MKNHFTTACLFSLAALLLCGCERYQLPGCEDDMTAFLASFEDLSVTKTHVDSNLSMSWNANDNLSIFTTTLNEQYSFDGKTGDNSGTFTKAHPGQFGSGNPISAYYAVYPYDSSTSLAKDGKISLSLPAVQNYAQGSFGLGSNTMVAVTGGTSDYFLSFKNLCGYLVVKLYGEGTVKSVSIKGNDGEKLAGPATVTATYGTAPTLEFGNNATDSITIDCGKGVALDADPANAKEFWFCIPPVIFPKGYTVTATNTSGWSKIESVSDSMTIARNTKYGITSLEAKFDTRTSFVSDRAINFKACTKTAVTKGTTATGVELDSIGVFTFYQPGSNGAKVNFNSHKFSTPDFMYNQKVSSKDGIVWSYSPVKYWPDKKGDQLSFFAYAPYRAGKSWEDMGIATDANGSKLKVSFPINADVKDQVDYLWADPQVNKSADGSATVAGSDSTVNFTFSHITSQLSLYLGVAGIAANTASAWTDESTIITVEKVEFKGLADKIALKYSIPDFATGDPEFTASGDQNIVLSREGKNFQNDTINKANYGSDGYRALLAKKGNGENGYMFLAPQPMTDAEIVLTYNIKTEDKNNPANSSVISNTIIRKWSTAVPAITNLEAGKAYKLYILIGMDTVSIAASATPWEDVGIYSL